MKSLHRYSNIEVRGILDDSGKCLIESRVHGFFACLYCILYGYFICERENLKGIVMLGKDHLYYEPAHGPNVFDYFFEQESEGLPSLTIKILHPEPFLKWCHISISDRLRAKEIIDKKLSLKKNMQKQIDEFVNQKFAGLNILGVHYRSRDKGTETVILPFELYLEKIEFILERNICQKVFFCSDDLQARLQISRKYGDKVLLYRLEGDYSDKVDDLDSGLHFNSKSPYLHAKDALIETYLLSSCTVLLSSQSSSMSLFSTFLNPALLHIPLEH